MVQDIRKAPGQGIIQPQMSTVPELRNPDVDEEGQCDNHSMGYVLE